MAPSVDVHISSGFDPQPHINGVKAHRLVIRAPRRVAGDRGSRSFAST